jgi:NAD(P)-dependent dehydrogenase (short-subunit alcohol dehydrogenase family)
VTGGARGIGLAIARDFVQAGEPVAVTYRNSEPPEAIAGFRCDVTDEESVVAALGAFEEQFGPVQVLVANVGITADKLTLRMSDDDFSSVVEANLTSTFRLARMVSPGMIEAGWGRMIFVSSMIAYFGAAGQVNYAASKSGLTGLARSLAWELGARNITVNVVALIETDMTKDLPARRRDFLIAMTPLGCMGRPEDVAHVVRFLASDEASFISGAVIPVSGGCGMGY